MPGRKGLFGLSRFPIAIDRSKFDPDLHPDHAPWVPEEHGEEYFALVKQRTAGLGSGQSSASAELHKRNGKAWVSFGTAHAGIAFEWGSYAQHRKLILSSSAAKFRKKSKSPEAKEAQAKITKRLKEDAEKRLERGMKEGLKFALTGRHATTGAAATVRDRLRAALRDVSDTQPVTTTLPYHVLERIKRPFRATETAPARKPGARLLGRLRQVESLSDIRRIILLSMKDRN